MLTPAVGAVTDGPGYLPLGRAGVGEDRRRIRLIRLTQPSLRGRRSRMAVTVETTSGRVAGVQEPDHQSFRGIPFAKPPLGELRFRAPEAAEPWSGERDASAFGPSADDGDTIPRLRGLRYLNPLTGIHFKIRRKTFQVIDGDRLIHQITSTFIFAGMDTNPATYQG